LYELRLLQHSLTGTLPKRAKFVPGQKTPGKVLLERGHGLSRTGGLSEPIRAILRKIGFQPEDLLQGLGNVLRSAQFQSMLPVIQEPLTPYRVALARAAVAQMIVNRNEAESAATIESPLLAFTASATGEILENLVGAIAVEFGAAELGIAAWTRRHLLGLAQQWGTKYLSRNRQHFSQSIFSEIGDILLYQTRGQAIRDYILDAVLNSTPPVLLLGHSLGGVMCVDLAVQRELTTHVGLLVTVGSQSPFFFELDALSSLRWGEPLPLHFPPWLNIYDHRDFLSYAAAAVFPGRVKDEAVDNRQPFPQSHSAYWTSQRMWDLIKSEWSTVADTMPRP
jgi:pimeloyl-ACP methyl ester carboxylesterase